MKKAKNPKFFMLLTGLTVIGGVAITLMQYSSIQDTEATVAKLRKDSLNQSELENNLRNSETKLQQCSASLNHLEKGVPELDYVPTMLKELENIGTQNGLVVLGVRPIPKQESSSKLTTKERKTAKQYTELDIEVTCRGTYKAIKSFVTALQTFPKIVADRTVTLTPKPDKTQSGPPKLEATITLRSYLFPPDKRDMKQASPTGVIEPKETIVNAS